MPSTITCAVFFLDLSHFSLRIFFECVPKHLHETLPQTKPVWITLFPLITGGCVWAGYVSSRTLFGHNEIVYVIRIKCNTLPLIESAMNLTHCYSISAKGEEPYLLRDSPKLLSRQRNISTHKMYDQQMDGKQ